MKDNCLKTVYFRVKFFITNIVINLNIMFEAKKFHKQREKEDKCSNVNTIQKNVNSAVVKVFVSIIHSSTRT